MSVTKRKCDFQKRFSSTMAITHAILFVIVVFISSKSSESSSLGYSLQLYNAINFFRALHTVPALRWNKTLTDIADNFAMRILSGTSNSFATDIIVESQGVNFFVIPGTIRPSAYFVAETWYNESNFYDYTNPGYSSQYLNYTQMVWKSSTSVGIGTYTDTDNNYTSIVAKFYPAGNLRGKFRQNVVAKYKKM